MSSNGPSLPTKIAMSTYTFLVTFFIILLFEGLPLLATAIGYFLLVAKLLDFTGMAVYLASNDTALRTGILATLFSSMVVALYVASRFLANRKISSGSMFGASIIAVSLIEATLSMYSGNPVLALGLLLSGLIFIGSFWLISRWSKVPIVVVAAFIPLVAGIALYFESVISGYYIIDFTILTTVFPNTVLDRLEGMVVGVVWASIGLTILTLASAILLPKRNPIRRRLPLFLPLLPLVASAVFAAVSLLQHSAVAASFFVIIGAGIVSVLKLLGEGLVVGVGRGAGEDIYRHIFHRSSQSSGR